MACAISISVSVNGSSLPRNTFRAPMTSVRTRSGTAHIRLEARPGGLRGEDRPAGAAVGRAGLHGPARGVRVQARALRALKLEQLQQPHPLLGGGDQPQAAARVGQHHPGRLGPENLHRVRPPGRAGNRQCQSRWPACPPAGQRPGPARPHGPRHPHWPPGPGSPAGRGAQRRSHSSNRTRRSTTSCATSYIDRPLANAAARSRASALAMVSSSCAAIIPVAWWITIRSVPAASSSARPGPPARSAGTARHHGRCPPPPEHRPDAQH